MYHSNTLVDQNVLNAQPKCPKGLKVSKYVKGVAAMMACNGATKEQQRRFMRTMGIAMHQAANRSRNTPRPTEKDAE